jgi:hypothetical protein
MCKETPSSLAQAATPLSRIREMPGSNLDRDTDCRGYGFTQFLQANAEIVPYITSRPPPSTPLHFIIHFNPFGAAISVGIATGYGLDLRGIGVRVPYDQDFSPLHVVETGSGAHPAFCPMSTKDCFLGGKATGT